MDLLLELWIYIVDSICLKDDINISVHSVCIMGINGQILQKTQIKVVLCINKERAS